MTALERIHAPNAPGPGPEQTRLVLELAARRRSEDVTRALGALLEHQGGLRVEVVAAAAGLGPDSTGARLRATRALRRLESDGLAIDTDGVWTLDARARALLEAA